MSKIEQYIEDLVRDNDKTCATIDIMLRCLDNGINNFDMSALLEITRDHLNHSGKILGKVELLMNQSA